MRACIKDRGRRLASVKIYSRQRGLTNHSLSPEDNMITSLDETSAAIRRDSSAMSKAECQVRELLVNQISTETLANFRFLVPPQLLLEAETTTSCSVGIPLRQLGEKTEPPIALGHMVVYEGEEADPANT